MAYISRLFGTFVLLSLKGTDSARRFMKNLGLFSACIGSESGTRPGASPDITFLQTTTSPGSKGLSPSQKVTDRVRLRFVGGSYVGQCQKCQKGVQGAFGTFGTPPY